MTTEADYLIHFGTKGMKWGVRKEEYRKLRNAPKETATFKTAKGTEVTLKEHRTAPIPAALGAMSPKIRDAVNSARNFDVHVGDKRVGNVAVREKSKEEVNFAWIGVDKKHRGQGYASTIFDAGVEYARRKGYDRITLEVPGNAPDARHIYEKRGFTPTGKVMGNSRDIWGGLTEMSYTIPKEGRSRNGR